MEIITTILVILVFARICGEVFARIKQPSIIGEMIAGIILGPSILNLISPEVKGIDILAEFGVFFLLFLAGMRIQLASFKEYSRPAFFIAIIGNSLAILSGITVGKIFSLDFLSSLFVGIVFSLTALPVGIRILMDLGKPDGWVIVTDFRDTWVGRRTGTAHNREAHGPLSVNELETLFAKAGLNNVNVYPVKHWVVGVNKK